MRTNFTLNNKEYNKQENGYCFVIEDGKKTRISGAKFNEAYDEFVEWQIEQEREAKEAEQLAEVQIEINEEPTGFSPDLFAEEVDKENARTDYGVAKPKTKKRSRKDMVNIPLESGEIVSLTEKQLLFIERMPEDDFWENGIDSALWVDCYCDTISNELNAMQVGAMVSTLREKGLLVVAGEKRNGRKANAFGFTELGKKLAVALGLK